MRQRLKRMVWWVRRLRGGRIVAFLLVLAGAATAGWLYGGVESALAGGGAALIVVGVILARPVAAVSKRLFLRRPSWRANTESLSFAGADLGFRVDGAVGRRNPRQLLNAIADTGGRFSSGDISLELWLVATDESGQDWTVVQEVRERPAGPVAWTSSVDAGLARADFDRAGRPDPYRAAHRMVEQAFDVAVTSVEVLGWGREQSDAGTRDTVVAFARTSLAAEDLSGFQYANGGWKRVAHLVTVDLDGVAKTLGWGHPLHWRGGAAFGLLELFESVRPGAWTVLERRVAPRWHEKGMFVRVEREAERITERAMAARS